MTILELEIENFRNLECLRFIPSPGVNIIYGDNAQGKTNLTEAIWLLTGNRSFRGAKDSELCRFSAGSCHISARFEAQGRTQDVRLELLPQKKAFRNGIEQPVAELDASLRAVVFSPVHLAMVKDGPAARRRFLDGAVTQLYPRYPRYLMDMQRILAQRGALLREIPQHAALLDHLEEWDIQFARVSGNLMKARSRYVKRLAGLAADIYEGISGGEDFSIAYEYSIPGLAPLFEEEGETDDEAIRQEIVKALVDCRGEDIRRAATTIGPHRDDITMMINGISARAYGSQGQQRSAVLALKLAECSVLHQITGEQPLVLLDDVLSELDGGRRAYLLGQMNDRQVFITCCDQGDFASHITAQNAKTIAIQGGRLLSF